MRGVLHDAPSTLPLPRWGRGFHLVVIAFAKNLWDGFYVKTFLKIIVVLLLLGACVLGGALAYVFAQYKAPGPLEGDAVVVIEAGTGFKAIAAQLEAAGVIADARMFMLPALFEKTHRDAKAGEYAFAARISPRAVMEKLVKGDVVVHQITIPEGLTTQQVLALIAAEERLTGDVPEGIAEGALLPETYQFLRGDTREKIVNTMQESLKKVLAEAWETRAEGLPLATPEEALVLASIVERETGVASERAEVAGVYVNRLRLGMLLQADPTVAYGVMVEKGVLDKPLDRPLLRGDLKRDTPYNTYIRAGLPPTPIACVGAAAIRATLNPQLTDALYFVATGNGGHRFARTLEEHNRNVAEYRKVLRALQ